ncbi:MAG TPA: enolase C-terminal domain-like protein [Bryobacteraceae bacterium]|nr:enolase C-terminal domain-like protein [Bryobacteraceae bacterium]
MITRRNTFKTLAAANLGSAGAAYSQATRGLPPLKITAVKVIVTCPPFPGFNLKAYQRLVVTKVQTSEPGLYGVGCATFTFRPEAVVAAIEQSIAPFVIGKDPDCIEDLWAAMNASSLWRSGPVLHNSISGIDMALWDIKGKRAGMPVYQLLGGKMRSAAQCYAHAAGRDAAECSESVKRLMAEGFQHIRIELSNTTVPADANTLSDAAQGLPTTAMQDGSRYILQTPKLFEHVRKTCGEEVELLHDIHGELHPVECIAMIKRIEPYRPYFIEDPFYPEEIDFMPRLRQATVAPIAIGEKFVNNHEYVGLIKDRLIDFIRVHQSYIGGITRARRLAVLCEWHGVRTAWHAPRDTSPIGHAANLHLDLAIPNFGVQERIVFGDVVEEVFPGSPKIRKGMMYANEGPGLGIDIHEKLAAKFPLPGDPGNFGPKRRREGGVVGN